ncbi:MAG: hypothetical protein ABL996_16845 [Micropepsaceae bacterium]
MRMKRAILLMAAAALVAGPAVAAKKKPAAPACVKGKLLTAFQMRMMQTELVVGALSCKLTPRYNEFVKAYQPELMSAHRSLKAHFGREAKLEDYKSKTANESSQRSLANITEFCLYTSALYDKLLGPERVQLATFVASEPAASWHDQDACEAPALVTASATGKVVPMPRMKPGSDDDVPKSGAVVTPEATASAPEAAPPAPTQP